MKRKKVVGELKAVMCGCLTLGVVITFIMKELKIGLGFIGAGLFLAIILQFIFGEDIIRIRKPKRMK